MISFSSYDIKFPRYIREYICEYPRAILVASSENPQKAVECGEIDLCLAVKVGIYEE